MKLSPRTCFTFTVCWLAACGSVVKADMITLQEGVSPTALYQGAEDTWLLSDFGNDNFGQRDTFTVGPNGASRDSRSVIRFDVSSIDGDYDVIDSITLNLTISQAATSANTLQLFELHDNNEDWVEGNGSAASGGPVDAEDLGGTTWDNKIQGGTVGATTVTSVPWNGSVGAGTAGASETAAGTDYVSTTLASAAYSAANGDDTVITLVISDSVVATALVNDWLDGTNGGFLLRALSETGTGQIQFHSSQATTSAFRPELIVEFSIVPEPTTGALATLGLVGAVWQRRPRRRTHRGQNVETLRRPNHPLPTNQI